MLSLMWHFLSLILKVIFRLLNSVQSKQLPNIFLLNVGSFGKKKKKKRLYYGCIKHYKVDL